MTQDWVTVIGLLAAACTTGALLPQVAKIIRTRETRDISAWMYIITSIGVFLWFVYGIYLADLPIMIANGLTFILAVTVLAMKIKYG
jgi:MtN3 and saliva related transmembrane protein